MADLSIFGKKKKSIYHMLLRPTRNEYGICATKAKSVLSGIMRTEQDLRNDENDDHFYYKRRGSNLGQISGIGGD